MEIPTEGIKIVQFKEKTRIPISSILGNKVETSEEFTKSIKLYLKERTKEEIVEELGRTLSFTHDSVKLAYFISILNEQLNNSKGKEKVELVGRLLFEGIPISLQNKASFKGDIGEYELQLKNFIGDLKEIVEKIEEEYFEGFKEFFDLQIKELIKEVK